MTGYEGTVPCGGPKDEVAGQGETVVTCTVCKDAEGLNLPRGVPEGWN